MVNPTSNVSAQKFKNTTPAEQAEAINQKDLIAQKLRQMKTELVNWMETPKDISFILRFKMSTSALWRAHYTVLQKWRMSSHSHMLQIAWYNGRL